MRHIAIAELPSLIGQEIGVSDWLEVTQDQVNRFADTTDDHQWVHVDVERATQEMGGPIAHGFLTLSLLSVLSASIYEIAGLERTLNYGFNKVRFVNMVRVGARVRLKHKLLAIEAKGPAIQASYESIIEIEDDPRPALIAEWLLMHYPS